MEELATTETLHHFVPNVKFSRLQRRLKKIHSEELYSDTKYKKILDVDVYY